MGRRTWVYGDFKKRYASLQLSTRSCSGSKGRRPLPLNYLAPCLKPTAWSGFSPTSHVVLGEHKKPRSLQFDVKDGSGLVSPFRLVRVSQVGRTFRAWPTRQPSAVALFDIA